MSDCTLSIKISEGSFGETFDFPIKPTNSSKAILVEFECGYAWVLTDTFYLLKHLYHTSRGKYCLDISPKNLQTFLQHMKKIMRDELVPVKKAGKGPTDKSHKFKVNVLTGKHDHNGNLTGDLVLVSKTMTLGWFSISEIKGNFFAQRKVIEEKLEREFSLPRGLRAHSTLRLMLETAAEKINKALEIKTAEQKRLNTEARIALEKQREEIKAIEADRSAQKIKLLLPGVVKEGNNAISFCKNNFTLADMRRKLNNSIFFWNQLPDIPLQPDILSLKQLELLSAIIKISKCKLRLPDKVIEGATVKWVDWIGPSSKRVRQDNENNGCTVRFFGLKREIICQDGDIFIKMEGPNLQITGGIVLEATIE